MTKETKQTALEQFAIALYEKGLLIGNGDWMQDVLKEFKEMEKQQHLKTFEDSIWNMDFEQYYKDRFGGSEQ
jgi:hypothetical protein